MHIVILENVCVTLVIEEMLRQMGVVHVSTAEYEGLNVKKHWIRHKIMFYYWTENNWYVICLMGHRGIFKSYNVSIYS